MRFAMKFSLLTLTLLALLAACNMPAKTPNAAATVQAIYTLQAGTAQAAQGQTGSTGTPSVQSTLVFPTLPAVTIAPTQQATQSPPASLTPTQKPVAYCNWVAFVKDVTVPDGTVFAPGTQFTKTWRLQNIGTCSWTTDFALVFSNGNNMGGASSNPVFASSVNPGQTVDISVNLSAPSSEGAYRGYWLLRNASGVLFGLGPSDRDPFYVDIKVVGGMSSVYDFANSYCSASWNSGAGNLGGCTSAGSAKGYAAKVDNPQLENGQAFTGPGLITVPENTNNGYLQGYYPPFAVQKGDHFRAIVNCAYLANGCNAIFRLDYQINSDAVKTLWQTQEAYEGQFYTVDIDLSPLAGSQVKFVLSVLANGSADNDKLLWAGPRIERLSNQITPSPIPSVTSTPTATPTTVAYP